MTRRCRQDIGEALHRLQPFVTGSMDLLPLSAFEGCGMALVDLRRLAPLLGEGQAPSWMVPLLSGEEWRLFSGFSFEKRRLEWLGGRLAAKYALFQLFNEEPFPSVGEVSIMPDPHGRPVLVSLGDNAWNPGLSLSHSGDYAGALACRAGSCGLDIQLGSERLIKVRERFASDAEVALLDGVPEEMARLAILWTVKEAVKKCFLADQPTFFGNIRVSGYRRQSRAGWLLSCRVKGATMAKAMVHVVQLGRYFLAGVRGVSHA